MPLFADPEFHQLLSDSYARLLGHPLGPDHPSAALLYHEAPFAVLAHNTEPDPRFIYANKAAQACFEYTWEEFIQLPSRLSAEAPDRAERQRLLDAVARQGYISNYQGIRIAKSGRRFEIGGGTVWQLIDRNGAYKGQAACFSSWRDV